jgi:biofilm protein TabA
MIADSIKNISIYKNISERLSKGLEILTDKTLLDKPDGKYEVDGANLFYLVQRYKTKSLSEAKFEAHRKYIDIQAVLKGKEIIGFTNIAGLKESAPYKEDVVFFDMPKDYIELKMHEETFTVLFPEDAHMPACDLGGKNDVLKIVVKIKL